MSSPPASRSAVDHGQPRIRVRRCPHVRRRLRLRRRFEVELTPAQHVPLTAEDLAVGLRIGAVKPTVAAVGHDFASPGWERREELETFADWLRFALDDFIDWG